VKAAVELSIEARDGTARAGTLFTPHGRVATPAFMPVGTRGSVRGLDSADLEQIGAEIVLANTYHLMLRPGAATVAALGELQDFMGWHGPVLTDSGGYQVFSLDQVVTEDGVVFRSTYDGSRVELTPERAVAVQETLGSDIAMVLDELVGLPAPREVVAGAMERTLRWSQRALDAKQRTDRALFGIVQGGIDPDLRARSAAATAQLGFAGFGIGGLSVGESRNQMAVALEAAIPELPAGAPRYVMGLGDTERLLDAVCRGVDMFDCVLPTRLARHGKVLHPTGDFSIKRVEWAADESPLQIGCDCPACARYSRGYIRHLFQTKERLAGRLVSLHNLRYTLRLLADARLAIMDGSFSPWRDRVLATRRGGLDGDFEPNAD
jgi:queuine tRNA-ribosyltransferase